MPSHIALPCADASFCYRARRGGVGDAGGIEPACTDAPDGARPRGERKDALDTVALHVRRCRAQMVASIAAAAAASVGVKPQAEAPHSAPVAPRNALRRRLRRRTCTARARAQRHRSVLRGHELARLRVRAQLLRSARASRRAAKGAQVDGELRDGWRRRRPSTRLEPAAAGRRTRARGQKKLLFFLRTDARTTGFENCSESSVRDSTRLAFFRVPRILLVYILAPTVSAGRASCLRPGYLALAVEQRHASVPVWPPAPTAAAAFRHNACKGCLLVCSSLGLEPRARTFPVLPLTTRVPRTCRSGKRERECCSAL